MKIKALLIAPEKPGTEVSVTIEARVAEKFSFANPAMEGVGDLSSPLSQENPHITWEAIEGACISGGYYARHLLGVENLAIELLGFDLRGDVENVIPFAIATRVAICASFTERSGFAGKEWEGWRVSAVEAINDG